MSQYVFCTMGVRARLVRDGALTRLGLVAARFEVDAQSGRVSVMNV